MNQTSSRAHTIITIEFKQLYVEDGRKIEKFSVINSSFGHLRLGYRAKGMCRMDDFVASSVDA